MEHAAAKRQKSATSEAAGEGRTAHLPGPRLPAIRAGKSRHKERPIASASHAGGAWGLSKKYPKPAQVAEIEPSSTYRFRMLTILFAGDATAAVVMEYAISTYMRTPLSRELFSVVLSDLDSSWLRI
jgi:hypothetical protein